jgi:hypothetical protein
MESCPTLLSSPSSMSASVLDCRCAEQEMSSAAIDSDVEETSVPPHTPLLVVQDGEDGELK